MGRLIHQEHEIAVTGSEIQRALGGSKRTEWIAGLEETIRQGLENQWILGLRFLELSQMNARGFKVPMFDRAFRQQAMCLCALLRIRCGFKQLLSGFSPSALFRQETAQEESRFRSLEVTEDAFRALRISAS